MTDTFWKELKNELQQGISKKGHAFQYATLATVGMDKTAHLRTIVLRSVSEELELFVYTDKRSKKITHIQENPKVSMLFYHPEKLLQLKVEGLAHLITDKSTLTTYWNNIPTNNRKDYITTKAPGSTIKNPDQVEYLDDENHFCIIKITPYKIEYLKLKRPHHIKISFSKQDDASWHGEFLVP